MQVWFPYYGWQSFDPTAVVPLANPSPAHLLLHDVGAILAKAPWVPVGIPLAVLFGAAYTIRAWRRRPATWAEQVARKLERLGVRARSPRRAGETLTEFAARLDASCGDPSGTLRAVATVAEAAAYGRREPTPEARGQLDATLRASPLWHLKFRLPASWSRREVAPERSDHTADESEHEFAGVYEPGALTPPGGQDPDRMSHPR